MILKSIVKNIHIKFYSGYISHSSIDANKHPDEQVEDLINLIKNCKSDTLEIYCNSPYVQFRITLLYMCSNKNIPVDKKIHGDINITNQHFEILKDGRIVEGKYYKGMIYDDCFLNNTLANYNTLFAELLEYC